MSTRFVDETIVPTRHGRLRFLAFRGDGIDHLAVVGLPTPAGVPLVRVHSECVTGEAFGSLLCDCGPQLDAALALVATEGGAVIYLRGQEGRGIGLAEKIRAYRLQTEAGLDTVDANLELGHPADARDYRAAADMLRHLGLDRIRLLTNNPDKATALADAGIDVAERVPLVAGTSRDNANYRATKVRRMGHDPLLAD